MDVGKSLAESIEGATTAYYRDGGGTETGIAADERLVDALKQAYIAAYARNDGGSLDTVRNELAEFGGREPTTNEICEAAIALAGKQAKQDASVISRMFKLQAASLAEEYAPALVRTFDAERAQKADRGIAVNEKIRSSERILGGADMYLVDDYGEPYVALFSVQYTPKYSDYPCRPHDACFKLKRDPKGREGVFIQPFSRDGISPVARVSHEVEAALALGWPELSPNGYVVEFPGHYDDAKEIGSFSAGHERLMELPILMGILELEGIVENAERDSFYGALAIDEEANEIRVEVPEDVDIEFRYWLRNNGAHPVSSKEMPTVPINRDPNRISKEVEAIISEKTPERFMRSLLDSRILRDGASPSDIAALRSGLDGLLAHGVAGTKSLTKSLEMRERSTHH